MSRLCHHMVGMCVLLGVLLAFAACENDLAAIKRLDAHGQAGVETARTVSLLYSDSARVRVHLRATVMLNYLDPLDPRREFPKGVEITFFDPNTQPSSYLTARRAKQYEQKRLVILEDSVHIWNTEGQHLYTHHLVWDEQNGKVYSNDFVTLIGPRQAIHGYGLRSNIELTDWQLRQVSGFLPARSLGGELED